MKVLTDNFRVRAARANAALRHLRAAGYRVIACDVPPGNSLARPALVVSGGSSAALDGLGGGIFDVAITRQVGGAS